MSEVLYTIGSGVRVAVTSVFKPFIYLTTLIANVIVEIFSFFLGPPYRILCITTRVLYPIYLYILAAIVAGTCIGLISGGVSEMFAAFLSERMRSSKYLDKTALGDEIPKEPEWIETEFDDDEDDDDEGQDFEVVSTSLKSIK